MILRLLRWLDAHVLRSWRCVDCGCTERFACPGGCGWSIEGYLADEHLCTSCCDDPDEARLAMLRELAASRAERACR